MIATEAHELSAGLAPAIGMNRTLLGAASQIDLLT